MATTINSDPTLVLGHWEGAFAPYNGSISRVRIDGSGIYSSALPDSASDWYYVTNWTDYRKVMDAPNYINVPPEAQLDELYDDLRATGSEGMTPVEYRIVGAHSRYGADSVRMVGDIFIGRERIGHWSTTIKEQYLDAVKGNLCSRKEQSMAKCLFEVYVVHKGKFLDMWTGIASTPENARFRALKELQLDIDIEDLDIFTRQIGILSDDCCN